MTTLKNTEIYSLANNIACIIDNALHHHTVLFDKYTFGEQITMCDILQILESMPHVEIYNVLLVITDLLKPKIIFQLQKNYFMVTGNEVTNIENIDDILTCQDSIHVYTFDNFKKINRQLIQSKL